MYCYGTGNNCYPTQSPCTSTCHNTMGSNYAIVLVLFILLVIIQGTRNNN